MTLLSANQQYLATKSVTIKTIKWVIVCVFSISIVACGGEKKETRATRESPEIVINPNANEQADKELAESLQTKDTTADAAEDVVANQTKNAEESATNTPENPTPEQATPISNPDIPTPSALDLSPENIKTFEQETTHPGMFMEDQFYPIGWSANGEKLAYAIVHETDAAALFSVTVYIQDLVTDKLAWKTSKESENGNFGTYWSSNYKKISAELDKNKIVFGENIARKQAPIAYRDDVFGYNINRKESKKGAQLVGYQLLLLSDKKGSKVISKASFSYKPEQPSGTKLKIQVAGHFQSPKEGRIALLVGILESGWEGSKIVRYKVIGASLKAGKWK